MPVWILIVIIAQFLNAVVAVVDKHIVTDEKVSQPISYAFYVGILSTLSLAIFFLSFVSLDFGSFSLPHIQQVLLPSLKLTLLSLLAGYTFIAALFFLYTAFKKSDASDVVPVVGSTNAIVTFIISFIFIGEVLTDNFVLGFTFLIMSMIILSHFRFTGKILACSIISGIFSAIYFVSMKIMFNDFAFDQAFFWSRMGILAATLTILLIPLYRRGIFSGFKKGKAKNILWVIGNSILGGIAGIALLKATELGSVTVVQVMSGLQFTFLVIFSILFGRVTPTTFGENNNINDIIQKVVSVSFIVIGFYLLFR
jgi:drug/metabolite transporter (DMT)-like permease